MAARLSVNVNKVATLRNSRGGSAPSVLQAVRTCLTAGARGITVHPRADERHITVRDVLDIAELLASEREEVELNIEGDPRPDWLRMVAQVRPHQATLVPVKPGEITSDAGWQPEMKTGDELRSVVSDLRERAIRVSLFVDPEPRAVAWAEQVGADRVELYTGPFARAWLDGWDAARHTFSRYAEAAAQAHELGLGVNAGHDLDLDNLVLFRRLNYLDEVSIGHALISRALFVGLETVVHEYLQVLAET